VLSSHCTPLLVGSVWVATTVAIAVACVGVGVDLSTAVLLLTPCVGPIVVVLLIGSNPPVCRAAELLHGTTDHHSA
jgi:hypothetical protein